MNTTAPSRTAAARRVLSEADLAVLAAVGRLGYLTASQLGRLLYPDCHDENRYARRRLARLAVAGLLLRLTGLPVPRSGSAPQVYTLSRAGQTLLAGEQRYLRPAEEAAKARNQLFMTHTLATVDVLTAAERLCRTQPVTMPQLLIERQLRVHPTRVRLPAVEGTPERSVAVIPDAWLELVVAGRQPMAIAVELDRGTEDQRRWRGKVTTLAAWATGPYRDAFGADTLTIAVVTPNPPRREALRSWTAQELTRTGQLALVEIFLVTCADPVTTDPAQLFFTPCWWEPVTPTPVALLPSPQLAAAPAATPDTAATRIEHARHHS